ncbi:O-methyltransferase [Membranihabitans maritimus]|uniref:O-methyltransferase n=1 Tax=Membranihabitans maritimus TaxID=2904244 RepID=UPI001F3A8223|nr:O-methyltransferase [Membranihabitans maritimus]
MLEEFNKEVLAYCEHHTVRKNLILERIEQSTIENSNASGMMSGGYQGRLLSLISKMIAPEYVLEIGTFTGYAALCMAEGLKPGGKVITLERDRKLEPLIEKHLSWSPHGNSIEVVYGDASELIPTLDHTFDMVFIDAAKKQYANYYDLVFDKINPGGIILSDNVLWRGKVVDKNQDDKTAIIDQYNKKIYNDTRVEPFLLPIRDGIMLARKL